MNTPITARLGSMNVYATRARRRRERVANGDQIRATSPAGRAGETVIYPPRYPLAWVFALFSVEATEEPCRIFSIAGSQVLVSTLVNWVPRLYGWAVFDTFWKSATSGLAFRSAAVTLVLVGTKPVCTA